MTDAFVASLGMYDFAWTAAANDALWAGVAERLRAAGVDAPMRLSRGADLHATWRSAKLIFGRRHSVGQALVFGELPDQVQDDRNVPLGRLGDLNFHSNSILGLMRTIRPRPPE